MSRQLVEFAMHRLDHIKRLGEAGEFEAAEVYAEQLRRWLAARDEAFDVSWEDGPDGPSCSVIGPGIAERVELRRADD